MYKYIYATYIPYIQSSNSVSFIIIFYCFVSFSLSQQTMSLGRDIHETSNTSSFFICKKRIIHEDYVNQLTVVFSICLFLFICRITYHPKPFAIGSLPFDINYSSNNTYVNMPIMTMLVFQTIFVGVNRLFFSTRSNH